MANGTDGLHTLRWKLLLPAALTHLGATALAARAGAPPAIAAAIASASLLTLILAAEFLVIRPLRDLARATATDGTVDPRLLWGADELGQLARALRDRGAALAHYRHALDEAAIVSRSDVTGRIVSVNETFCRVSGYRADELIGENYRKLDSGYHTRTFWRDMFATLSTGRTWRGEIRNRAADGRVFWIDSTVVPTLDIDGRVLGYTAIAVDITERHAAVQAIRGAEEAARQASRAKSDFLASMSHELRTPLNGVLGFIDLLRGTRLDEEQADYVRTITTSGRSLVRIIDDILDFSAIEHGRLSLDRRPVDARAAVIEAVELMTPQLRQKGLDVAVCWTAESDYVLGDPLRVRQVLLNLLSNALKFTNSGRVSVVADRRLDRLRISVADTGVGMDADTRARVFEGFSQADYSSTRRAGGTGLGLAISRNLLALMEGDLECESTPGSGSTFAFSLEIADATHDTGPGQALDGLRLGIVDANPTHRRHLELLAARCGARVVEPAEADVRVSDDPATGGVFVYTGGGDPPAGAVGAPRPILRGSALESAVLAARDAARHAAPALTAPVVGRRRVLLADDNPVHQSRLAQVIRDRFDAAVTTADDGEAACARFAAGDFDLVLLDVHMPRRDGYESARWMREFEATHQRRPTPICGIVSEAGGDDHARGRDAGMNDHLTRPVRDDRLAEVLARLCPTADERPHPQVDPNREPAPVPDAPAPADGGRRVLVVEDNLVNQRLAARMLTARLGCEVVVANDGIEACERFQEGRFDAVFMDCHMPRRDGYEATQWIRNFEAENGLPRAPITALTADDQASNRTRCLEVGMDDHIAKPMRVEQLQAFLERFAAPVEAPPPAPVPTPPPTPSAEPAPSPAPERRRVLVVEDNLVNQKLAARLLTARLGCEVVLANDGVEGCDRFAEGAFDAVFMDCHMPNRDGYEATRWIRQFEAEHGRQRTPISALTADDQASNHTRCLECGMDAHIAKPIRVELLQAFLDAHAGPPAEPTPVAAESTPVAAEPPPVAAESTPVAAESTPVAAAPTPVAAEPTPVAAPRPRRVLVVEDNLVNQKLAVRLLTARLGCEVVVANDGVEGCDRFAEGGFDFVFMDCHMPNRDGYEATAWIRTFEADSDLPRTSISALTADDQASNRERCLAVGMDAHIAKPIQLERLQSVLDALCPAATPA